ncbi:MAG TPA: helicase C-terminal domain-containing protein [Gemmatimonadaceae bacterium]|nr:helicase C-terminal domain-containing protein [Gemmatimonadaceae bacterium]
MRAAIRLAGGREVCFVCTLDDDSVVRTARAVARGDSGSVLALPGFAQPGEMLVHNHPSGVLDPSDADYQVAARIHRDGIGFGIIDNEARELYIVVEVPEVKPETPLATNDIDRDLGPDGLIARLLPKYEDRPTQRELATTIADLYNAGGVGLLEAGTGIGKSLGYLVPALRWAAANGERTVVSTNTINLQEQLVGKDLPFLARALDDQKVRFALLKGWRNYLCLMRLEQARSTGMALFEDSLGNEISAISAWADRTTDGSLSDLPAPPRAEVWDEVSAEPDLCTRIRCQFYDKCFLFAARRKAAQADVIVVNHHLLMSDVAVRRVSQNWDESAVLPAYARLVVDEGHHMEDAAAAHLGATVTRRSLQRLFARLDRTGKGILPALMMRLAEGKDLLSAASLDLAATRLQPAVLAARDRAGLVFDLIGTVLEESGGPVMRLTEDFAHHRVWPAGLDMALGELLAEIEQLGEGLRVVRERIETDPARAEAVAPLLNELRSVARKLQTAGDALRRTLKPAEDAEEAVRWIEVRGKERNLAVTSVPLDLAPVLREDLFRRVKTAVVTSATLAADQRFEFLGRRLGLDDPELTPRTALYPSPFDFPRNARLAIPTNAPAPNVDAQAHIQFVVRVVLDVATASDGGMFVLATSHRDVRLITAELRARGVERRWPLLMHGDDGRDLLLKRFRESERAILVGTASFWEGVDVPGRALRGLVIAKLPFKVPNEPVTAAHCESIERKGGDAFREYMLPHASLRLKQGFGRLIRTASDRGVIVLVDSRVISKSYGRTLLEALPPARKLVGPWPTVLEQIQAFYASG